MKKKKKAKTQTIKGWCHSWFVWMQKEQKQRSTNTFTVQASDSVNVANYPNQ